MDGVERCWVRGCLVRRVNLDNCTLFIGCVGSRGSLQPGCPVATKRVRIDEFGLGALVRPV